METLKDLVAACRGVEGAVIETSGRTAPYTYEDFAPNVWKSGNLLGHYGVHPGAETTVVAGPKDATPEETSRRIDAADPLFAVLGATMVGASVRLQPVEPVESRTLVVPAGWTERYDVTPRCTRIAYGGPPTEPDVVHFEEEMWSENPIEPPERVAPDDPALVDEKGTYTHGALLATAAELVSEYDLDDGSRVALDAPVTGAGAILAVLGTVSTEATLVLANEDEDREDADLVVTEGESEGLADAEDGSGKDVPVGTLTRRLRDTRRA